MTRKTASASKALAPAGPKAVIRSQPYVASELMVAKSRHILHRDVIGNGVLLSVAAWVGVVGGCIMSLILSAAIAAIVSGAGYETRFGETFLWLWAISAGVITLPIAADMANDEVKEKLEAAKTRVIAFSGDFKSTDPEAHALLARTMTDDLVVKGDTYRPLLFRLDRVMLALGDTVSELGIHQTSIDRANAMARTAVLEIIERHRQEMDAEQDSSDALERLEHALKDAVEEPVDGRTPMMPTAPTARIARIVETAEKALASHPDLVDGQGARVDDLVRTHVPRLLRKHAEAARTASTQDVGEVDTALDRGVDAVRASVEEAIAGLHDLAMDELVTELRFLTLRRGAPPLLTSI